MKIVWLCNYSLAFFKNKIDVAFDSSAFHPTTWIFYMLEEIKRRSNVELHLITTSNILDKNYKFQENNITYHLIRRLPELPSLQLKVFNRLDRYIGLTQKIVNKKILKLVNEINPDIVNAHGTDTPYAALMNELDCPTIVWMQGMINQVINFENTSNMKKRLKFENDALTRQKHYITFPGEMEETILRFNPSAKFYNIYHPNPEYVFAMKNENYETDADIVFNGAIVKRKGVEDLLNAVSIVKNSLPAVKAKIIGYPGDRNYFLHLSKLIEEKGLLENVRFIGFLEKHEDVLREMKKSKILVLPTHVDTGPRSVAESITIGVPVISSNIDGLRNMITNNESGILVEVGDIESLANAITKLLNDAQLRDRLADNAFRFAQENYLPKNVIDKVLDTYKHVINEYHSQK
jgi:glycosyltransferase involved in cell wall biosynthesis